MLVLSVNKIKTPSHYSENQPKKTTQICFCFLANLFVLSKIALSTLLQFRRALYSFPFNTNFSLSYVFQDSFPRA